MIPKCRGLVGVRKNYVDNEEEGGLCPYYLHDLGADIKEKERNELFYCFFKFFVWITTSPNYWG